ncbi:hypothetical protein O5O51_04880 [Sinirhodobacter sp. HNIBRBA609]|nr:hypothetical protein O5O51_04880 [Sinirhodobacter sp. HNIBRBA609]
MAQEENTSPVRWLIMTALAWLGLAGLSDSIVVWQNWFEQGVMQHWNSTKEWIIAVLLWWVPFRVPSWLLDYLVISAIVIRSSPLPRWNENWRFGPEDAKQVYGFVPFRWKFEWAMSHVIFRWPKSLALSLLWPVAIPFLAVEAIRGKAFAPEIEFEPRDRRKVVSQWLNRIAWCFVSFIPVLFVCSTLLYEHG